MGRFANEIVGLFRILTVIANAETTTVNRQKTKWELGEQE